LTTPAVAAGLAEKPWSLERVVEMTDACWQPKIAAIKAEKAAARRLAKDAVFAKTLSGNQAVSEEAQGLDLVSVLLSFVPLPILERMIRNGRGNNFYWIGFQSGPFPSALENSCERDQRSL
jgi:hypothetical protein